MLCVLETDWKWHVVLLQQGSLNIPYVLNWIQIRVRYLKRPSFHSNTITFSPPPHIISNRGWLYIFYGLRCTPCYYVRGLGVHTWLFDLENTFDDHGQIGRTRRYSTHSMLFMTAISIKYIYDVFTLHYNQ